MSYVNPTTPAHGASADRALSEIGELATRLRRDLELAISTTDTILAEVRDARGEKADDPVDVTYPAIDLTFPPAHASLLRGVLRSCQRGVEEDLAGGQLPHPHRERAERERDAYGRLLTSIDDGAIEVNADVIEVVARLAEGTDAANDFEQAALEHRALCGLLGQLEAGRRS